MIMRYVRYHSAFVISQLAMEEDSSSLQPTDYVPPVWEPRVLTPAQMISLEDIRKWVETDAEFYGRTDDEFLLMFLFGCKFDVEKVKKKMGKYYDNRRKLSQWWANHDVKNPTLLSVLKLKLSEPMDGKTFDTLIKLNSMNLEIILRRLGTQTVGGVWLFDCADCPLWIITKFLNPVFLKNFGTSFLLASPIRLKSIVVLNCPLIVHSIWALARTFLPQKLRNRAHFYGSDWTKLYEHIDRECMPDEYGGTAGPLALHEEEYYKEFLSYGEFFSENNQYGYQTND